VRSIRRLGVRERFECGTWLALKMEKGTMAKVVQTLEPAKGRKWVCPESPRGGSSTDSSILDFGLQIYENECVFW
jgi:hypothetical protein